MCDLRIDYETLTGYDNLLAFSVFLLTLLLDIFPPPGFKWFLVVPSE